MKKIFNALLIALLLCVAANAAQNAEGVIRAMGAGWNLGNTLDACDDNSGKAMGLETETFWGMPKTTEAVFDTIKVAGFTTVRIPVSWHNHYANEKIDSAWMARVKEIVDMAMARNLYVVINIHHDTWNGSGSFWGYYPDEAHKDASIAYVKNVWAQVAKEFADYNDHLVFETINEPRLRNTKHEWWCNDYIQKNNCAACKTAVEITNILNQTALDTIRAAGGKNANRLVIIPSLIASPDFAFKDDLVIPKDSSKMIALSVHVYQPYGFAMESPGTKAFTDADKGTLDYYFNTLEKKFISNGVPVFIGEYGATNKNNKKARVSWAKYYTQATKKKGMAYCLWDNSQYQVSGSNYNEKFGFLDRKTLKWFDEDIIKAIVK